MTHELRLPEQPRVENQLAMFVLPFLVPTTPFLPLAYLLT